MKKETYQQTGVDILSYNVFVDDYDENGNISGNHEEQVTREIPVMSKVMVDMTEEEEAEVLRVQQEEANKEPTLEEKVNALLNYQGLNVRKIGNGVFEVVKESMPTGDYTNPIHLTDEVVQVKAGKWYYTTDIDLPHEAKIDEFCNADDFFDNTLFDYVELG